MKRLVWLVIAAVAAVGVVFVSPAVPAAYPDDPSASGPLCANITDGGIVDYDAQTQVLQFGVNTSKPSCPGVTYTLVVRDENTGVTQTVSAAGDKNVDASSIPPTPLLVIAVPSVTADANGDATVCVRSTTSDDRVFDVAPDDGCTTFTTAPIPPFGGFH